jgi:hypothetical protein
VVGLVGEDILADRFLQRAQAVDECLKVGGATVGPLAEGNDHRPPGADEGLGHGAVRGQGSKSGGRWRSLRCDFEVIEGHGEFGDQADGVLRVLHGEDGQVD